MHSNPADHSGGSPNPVQPAGFSLGHGSSLILPKLMTKILKWEYVSVGELLPDNLKLARHSAEAQRSASYSSKAPKKRELSEDWERTGGLVYFSTFTAIVSKPSRKVPKTFGLPCYNPHRSTMFQMHRMAKL